MFDRFFSGLKLSSAVLALAVIAVGLYFSACTCNKGEKAEKTGETESAVVATPEPTSTETPSTITGEGERREGMPPEITEPCSGKNEGDPCTVALSSGSEIPGSCTMTRKNILACKPERIIGPKKTPPGAYQPDTDRNQDQSE